MRGKEIVFALVCALVGAALAYVARMTIGNSPSPVIYYSLIIIGLGAALVVVRYGRVGPFDGELGAPGLETQVRDTIHSETERAMRYDREFTIIAVRQTAGPRVRWASTVRRVDDIVECRRDRVILLLPETSLNGALNLLHRVRELYAVTLEAAIVVCPQDGTTGDAISSQLLELIREPHLPNEVVVRRNGSTETLPLMS